MLRTPKAKSWVRSIWSHGLRLLQLSAVAQLAASSWLAWQPGGVGDDDYFVFNLILLGALVLTVGYLLRSRYLIDYFGDFPPPPPVVQEQVEQ
jgi:hypothetical protein